MQDAAQSATRCGIDTVEIARIERLLRETPAEDLLKIFSPQELRDSGVGPSRAASLAARFAAKEACLKLFPRETALGMIGAADFSVAQDSYGAPYVVSSPAASDVLNRHLVGTVSLSLSHDRGSAAAVALAAPRRIEVPLSGRIVYRLLPFRRRVVLDNLRRVFGNTLAEDQITRLAQAHYAHMWRLIAEFVTFSLMSQSRRARLARVENEQVLRAAHAKGKGVLLLTGHFGNFEVATAAGIMSFPEARDRFHFVRRPFKPRWLEAIVYGRARRLGFGTLSKEGSLDAFIQRLEAGDLVLFPFDQYAAGRDGIQVEFFGHPAGTFRSLAIIARATGAPVVPAATWREADGRHVLRFEEPLAPIECEDYDEEVRRNTRAYNAMLERLILRHPEQWWWMHRRWKAPATRHRDPVDRSALS
ncbi:MAG TPA: 4'-phosphopantetheinyl transferase superfamily protein [Burkholderiales bacterium]|nr:4'-phosphopantetheinyl transferase superfamily protein [Burkholderiales bacterium]